MQASIIADIIEQTNVEHEDSEQIYLGNQIGIDPISFMESFSKNQPYLSNPSIPRTSLQNLFVFLESIGPGINQKKWNLKTAFEMTDIGSLYVPKAKVWYRNLDWHYIFKSLDKIENPESHSTYIQGLLNHLTSLTPNYETLKSRDEREKNKKIINELISISQRSQP